jgi:hypothetical protein
MTFWSRHQRSDVSPPLSLVQSGRGSSHPPPYLTPPRAGAKGRPFGGRQGDAAFLVLRLRRTVVHFINYTGH